MAPPRPFGSACELDDVLLSGRSFHPGPGFHWILLQRYGKRPLALIGRMLLHGNNRCTGLPYWSEVSIYETVAGQFVASLRHAAPDLTTSAAWCDAWLCDSPDAVRTMFYKHDPLFALPLPWDAADGLMTSGVTGIGPSYDAVARDAVALQRFRGAWAGLLAAMFGLPAAQSA